MTAQSGQKVPQTRVKRAFNIWMSVRFEGSPHYLTRTKVTDLGFNEPAPYSAIVAAAAVLGLVHAPRGLHFFLMNELRNGKDTQPGDVLNLAMEPYKPGTESPYIMRFTRGESTISSGSASCSGDDLFEPNDEFIFVMP